MKKFSLILNVVLVIAVAVLYVLHFSSPKVKTSVKTEDGTVLVGEMGKIAYVNFDTLMLNYQYYIDLKDELFDKKANFEAELNSETKKFEKQVAEFQDKVQKGLVTRYQAADMENQLREKEQQLMLKKQQLEYQLMEEEQVMNRKLQYSIMDYLKDFNDEHGYSYVLSHTFGGPFLYTDSTLNVTGAVLDGINTNYNTKSKK